MRLIGQVCCMAAVQNAVYRAQKAARLTRIVAQLLPVKVPAKVLGRRLAVAAHPGVLTCACVHCSCILAGCACTAGGCHSRLTVTVAAVAPGCQGCAWLFQALLQDLQEGWQRAHALPGVQRCHWNMGLSSSASADISSWLRGWRSLSGFKLSFRESLQGDVTIKTMRNAWPQFAAAALHAC